MWLFMAMELAKRAELALRGELMKNIAYLIKLISLHKLHQVSFEKVLENFTKIERLFKNINPL